MGYVKRSYHIYITDPNTHYSVVYEAIIMDDYAIQTGQISVLCSYLITVPGIWWNILLSYD
jgi:hypothetical protein